MHNFCQDFETVTPELWMANEESWKEKLLKLPNWNKIPLVNSNASHNLSDGKLVRFRGMVQDMHNTEFYFEHFEVLNTVTNEIKIKTGKYTDTAHIQENERINYTENLKSGQRQTMVIISLPGYNEWAQKLEDEQNHLKHLEDQPNTSRRLEPTKLKRTYDETEESSEVMEVENEGSSKERRTKEDLSEPSNVVSREHLLNFPLPDVASKSCIVKIYDENDNLKLNDMIEVIGFLSVDPALSGEFQEKNSLEPVSETEVEIITHNPPPSLVPRLHAVFVKKLEHCNPLVKEVDQVKILNEANIAREHLLKALTELLLGDQLAAEYLICHLISSVYLRQDTITLGQFCLNISNLPTQKYPNYAKQLYDIIKQFVTKSYYLPLTVDNMNTMALLPKKDYECNRLTSGILQLSKDTHLVLDETQMQQGRLDAAGVGNITALGSLIKTQKVEYDFKYYKMEFDSDISVLILSEGKSLLPSDYHISLRPEKSSLEIFEAIVEAATYYLKEDIMATIRTYITSLKLVKYSISEDLQFVEEDFIEMRNESEDPVTADDLHRLLVLARLVSLSRGHDTLTEDCWRITKTMENDRLARLKSRPPTL
ncbi:mini-chromosome maintenance complex-binding protein [Danaus plexippus]|uniref:mini-chromosome maintenance complex-binding protein n=1 Tax=Danaus plexippus TaxID=13037 RepID=UPI002AAFAC07|nr:mini-chromosome maintenance complex-binding protein [Danaus plexippus]XP_061378338.1 mini-chromosome maintenance complex-binding protein [Danaus plexippus]